MAFTAAVTSPAAFRVAVDGETPSPMAPLEPPNFEIGSPPRGGPMASAEAAKPLENEDLLKRLDIANEKIVELAMKNSALQTELNLRKQIEEMRVELAVEKAKKEWEAEWEQDESSGTTVQPVIPFPLHRAPQPEARPPPAPGFATARWGWESSRLQFEASEPDPLPDSWAGAAAAMELAKDGGRPASAGVPFLATSTAETTEDLGEPLRDPHPKEFAPPKEYSGGADTWMS